MGTLPRRSVGSTRSMPLLKDITGNPFSGVRLSGSLEGWLVRHGGRDYKITIVFRPDTDAQCLHIALVAFGGQDWLTKRLHPAGIRLMRNLPDRARVTPLTVVVVAD